MPSLPLPSMPLPYEGQSKVLNADQYVVLQKSLKDEIFGLNMLLEHFSKNGQVELGVAHSVLSVSEHRRADLCKLLGLELDSLAERESRYIQLRQANGRIRELEQLLGQGASPEAVAMFMQNASKRLNLWWDTHGFGYIRRLNLGQWGTLEVEFSCSLHGTHRHTMSKTPVSDEEAHQQWLKGLTERGFVVRESKSGRDADLLDCDQSRATLQKLFLDTFASARVSSTDNHFDKGVAKLRGVTVSFGDLAEIDALPLEEAEG